MIVFLKSADLCYLRRYYDKRDAKMGRKSLYTLELQDKIVSCLATGATIRDTCDFVRIGKDTFYTWVKNKPEFADAVTYAQGQAKVSATAAIKSAIKGTEQVADTEEVFTETRIDKSGKPYEYRRTKQSRTVTHLAPDWRAAIEYLKRRDPANWAENVKLSVSVELIQKFVQAASDAGLDAGELFNDMIGELDAIKRRGT